MKQAFEAVYENGVLRPISAGTLALSEGERVRLTVEDNADPEPLMLASRVYEGLEPAEIDAIEEIALDHQYH